MNTEQLKNFFEKNNGYITTEEIERLGITKPAIRQLIDEKILRKVFHGIYIDNNNMFEDEYFILQKRFKDIVFSYNTAWHIWGLSERAPNILDITTKRSKRIYGNFHVHYILSEEIFNIGITETMSPYSNPIKVYNAERCICDMLRRPQEYEQELYAKIIKNYFKSREKDLSLLEQYAKIFNVEKKLKNIMEVLIVD